MTFEIRPRATADLLDIFDRLAETSPRAAHHFLQRAEETFDQIRRLPRCSQLAPHQDMPPTERRLLPVKRFRDFVVMYRVGADGVEVLRVLDGRRDLPELFPGD